MIAFKKSQYHSLIKDNSEINLKISKGRSNLFFFFFFHWNLYTTLIFTPKFAPCCWHELCDWNMPPPPSYISVYKDLEQFRVACLLSSVCVCGGGWGRNPMYCSRLFECHSHTTSLYHRLHPFWMLTRHAQGCIYICSCEHHRKVPAADDRLEYSHQGLRRESWTARPPEIITNSRRREGLRGWWMVWLSLYVQHFLLVGSDTPWNMRGWMVWEATHIWTWGDGWCGKRHTFEQSFMFSLSTAKRWCAPAPLSDLVFLWNVGF